MHVYTSSFKAENIAVKLSACAKNSSKPLFPCRETKMECRTETSASATAAIRSLCTICRKTMQSIRHIVNNYSRGKNMRSAIFQKGVMQTADSEHLTFSEFTGYNRTSLTDLPTEREGERGGERERERERASTDVLLPGPVQS